MTGCWGFEGSGPVSPPTWNVLGNSPGPDAGVPARDVGFSGGAMDETGASTGRRGIEGAGFMRPAWNMPVSSPGPDAAGAPG
jgi:hypothetical protein